LKGKTKNKNEEMPVMAVMIPDRLPSKASEGEKKLYSILQKLIDECVVYYEAVVKRRFPDFIVILPEVGLLVIEVKGWWPKNLFKADANDVVINDVHGEKKEKHPDRQARGYMRRLWELCERYPGAKILLQTERQYQNKFIFPFGRFSILSNITRQQLLDTLGKSHSSSGCNA
jgi:muconolactone delta-isomerase